MSNILGWSTKKKIVVIESDDWGSIRMSSRDSYQKLLNNGIPVSKNHYNVFDSLESNSDMSSLYEVLVKHKDKFDKSPVITAVTIVCNPDFDLIKASDYKSYYYESFDKTLQKYPSHDKVYSLYKYGIDQGIFFPVFHGREHLNVNRWMKEIKKRNESVQLAFNEGVTGIDTGINNITLPDFQAAFDIDNPEDLINMKDIIKEGLDCFKKLFGYTSKYFVPTNGPFNNSLEAILLENGVRYINSAKRQIEPLGNNKYRTNIRFLGHKNKLGQFYITRNCFFEPSSMEHDANKDWVSDCLRDIDIAFRWKKPAIISTHRVNYIGFLNPQNRVNGLSKLDILLNMMLKKWPDIEFMTSVELGELIEQTSYS